MKKEIISFSKHCVILLNLFHLFILKLEKREYGVPKFKSSFPNQISSKKRPQYPAFVGPNGILYDIDYLPIEPQNNAGIDILHSNALTHFPKAEDFQNFFDYEQGTLILIFILLLSSIGLEIGSGICFR